MTQSRRKRAATYARQSSNKQEHSTAGQEAVVRLKAEELNATVVREYSECCSGATIDERSAVQQMLRDAKSGHFDCIIIYDLSRLSREGAFSSVWIIQELFRSGVQVFDCKLDRFLTNSDAMEVFMEAEQAHKENTKRARDVSRGIHQSVTKRKSDPGRQVYGMDRLYIDESGKPYQQVRGLPDGSKQILDPKTKNVVQQLPKGVSYAKTKTHRVELVPGDPTHVRTTQRIFEMARQGRSATNIADSLNRQGTSGPKGGLWNAGTIRYLLRNASYMGDIQFNKREEGRYYYMTPDGQRAKEGDASGKKTFRTKPRKDWITLSNTHEGIVSRSNFEEVQRLLETRRGRKQGTPRSCYTYLLSGNLYCGYCGGRMQGQNKDPGNKRGMTVYRRYICSSARKYGKSHCPHYCVNADILEKVAIDRVREWIESPLTRQLILKHLAEQFEDQTQTEDQIKRLRSTIQILTDRKRALVINLDPAMLEYIKAELQEICSEITEKEFELANLENTQRPDCSTVLKECIGRYDQVVKGLLKTSCRNTQREFLREVGLLLIYNPNKKEVRLWFDPFVFGQLIRISA